VADTAPLETACGICHTCRHVLPLSLLEAFAPGVLRCARAAACLARWRRGVTGRGRPA
jgi:hypothetical protein